MAETDRRSHLSCLVEKCLRDDDRAWHELLDIVGPVIFSQCRKGRLSRDESFDIFGQVCLELVNTIASLRDPDRVVSFVITITRRQIYTFYQKMQPVEFADDQSLPPQANETQEDPHAEYELTRQREILLKAMGHLSERDRRLIVMLFFDPDEPTYEEIARKLKMPVSSIGPIRGKALRKLHRLLKQKRHKF